jgi:hypothetical protein
MYVAVVSAVFRAVGCRVESMQRALEGLRLEGCTSLTQLTFTQLTFTQLTFTQLMFTQPTFTQLTFAHS